MKKALSLVFLAFLVVGTILILRRTDDRPLQENSGQIFGTFYHIKDRSQADLQADIERELLRVDSSMSLFNATSTLSRLNRGETRQADNLFAEVLTMALQVAETTQGAFDPTVGPLVNAWGFGFKKGELPTDEEVDSMLQFVGHQHVRLNGLIVERTDARVQLDFGAIAKGYACDLVARLLESRGVSDYLVEIGGEIVVGGQKSATEQWRVGITKPSDEGADGELQEVVEMKAGTAMATSGNYRNFYVRNGRKYAHTINPHTGRPVEHTLLSATVVAPNCALADAYATAFMSMGLDEAKKLLAQHPELKAYLIYSGSRGEYLTYSTIEK